MDQPVNTGRKQDGRYSKGRSGNPNGRPAGSRNRTTLAAEALLEGEAESLTRKAIDLALASDDIAALRLCLERVLPARRGRLVQFDLPPLRAASDAPRAMAAITNAVAAGEITISEAGDLAKLVETYVKALETAELEARLTALEEKYKDYSESST